MGLIASVALVMRQQNLVVLQLWA